MLLIELTASSLLFYHQYFLTRNPKQCCVVAELTEYYTILSYDNSRC